LMMVTPSLIFMLSENTRPVAVVGVPDISPVALLSERPAGNTSSPGAEDKVKLKGHTGHVRL